jgi:hypothetical protein
MRALPILISLQAAFACPVCNSGTGQQVREGIFASDFGFNVAAAAAPFAICALIVRLISAGDSK